MWVTVTELKTKNISHSGDINIYTFSSINIIILSFNCFHSFIHSLYFPYIHVQVEHQGCGICHSCCDNIWQSYKCQMFQYNYNTMVT